MLPFLYLLKILQNRKVFWCFQEVENRYIGKNGLIQHLEEYPFHSITHNGHIFKTLLKAASVKCDTFKEFTENPIINYKRQVEDPYQHLKYNYLWQY